MIETRIRRAAPVCAADDLAVRASRSESRARPRHRRLWALLNAQALIRGAAGPDDIAFVEDDHQRLARRGN